MDAHTIDSQLCGTAASTHQPYVCSGATMFSDQAWREIARRLRLSGQELRIVRGVFDGRKESAIAMDLGISPHTVHTHFERLHHKLGVADRVELVLRIMEEFLQLEGPP
jgi:DNA-binding NarL/FixJ family response regulator